MELSGRRTVLYCFPLLIIIFWRYCRQNYAILICSVIILSISTAFYFSSRNPNFAFYLLPSRAWELAIGALIAQQNWPVRSMSIAAKFRNVFAAFGLILILGSVVLFDKNTTNPFPAGFAPVLGAALVITFADKFTFVGRLVGSSWLGYIGLISYSLYIWHQPIFVFMKFFEGELSEFTRAAMVVFVFIISHFSRKWIELPFMQGNFSKGLTFASFLCVACILTFVGSYTSRLPVSQELQAAERLLEKPAIYVTNIQERLFVRSRAEIETILPQTVSIGSSRIMQVSEDVLVNTPFAAPLLNFGMSGASVEDLVAVYYLQKLHFTADVLLVGADPWLFNKNAQNQRWRTLQAEFSRAVNSFALAPSDKIVALETAPPANSWWQRLYLDVNTYDHGADDDLSSTLGKVRRDGSRVYNIEFATRSQAFVDENAVKSAKYGMADFEFDKSRFDHFKMMLEDAHATQNVVLVLSPYHPELYEFASQSEFPYVETEEAIRLLASQLGIPVVGSYDPQVVGCVNKDFFDGIHPKESCMIKALNYADAIN